MTRKFENKTIFQYYYCTAIPYREIQGNPCNQNSDPATRTGFPVMKAGFSLWELTYREFPVSLTGFGFAVHRKTPKYYLILGRTASARYGALMASGHFGPCNIRSLRKKLLSEEFENSRLAPWAVTRDERFISHLLMS